VALTPVIASIFTIINAFTGRIFSDQLLSGASPSWVEPFLIILLVLSAIQLIAKWANLIYSLKISGKMAIEGNAGYLWKVLRLPMEFFSQRMAGDILMRQSTNASIAKTLVDTVAPLALNTVMMLIYLVIMLHYSVLMTLVGLGSLLLNLRKACVHAFSGFAQDIFDCTYIGKCISEPFLLDGSPESSPGTFRQVIIVLLQHTLTCKNQLLITVIRDVYMILETGTEAGIGILHHVFHLFLVTGHYDRVLSHMVFHILKQSGYDLSAVVFLTFLI
jgi:ABC-type multidrug transport system fused ATPase/permease subunit